MDEGTNLFEHSEDIGVLSVPDSLILKSTWFVLLDVGFQVYQDWSEQQISSELCA